MRVVRRYPHTTAHTILFTALTVVTALFGRGVHF